MKILKVVRNVVVIVFLFVLGWVAFSLVGFAWTLFADGEYTPAADVSYFEDNTNDTESVFGVRFGQEFEDVKSTCTGPFSGFETSVDLKIPKPVKWFTCVNADVDPATKRVHTLHFSGILPNTLSQTEIDDGVNQLKVLMVAKYGEDCLRVPYGLQRYNVAIDVSPPFKCLFFTRQAKVHLHVRNKD